MRGIRVIFIAFLIANQLSTLRARETVVDAALIPSAQLAKSLEYDDVVRILRANTNLNTAQTEALVAEATKQFGTNADGSLKIQGVMYSSGINYFLFLDRKHWDFSATYKLKGSGKLIRTNYDVEFFNGGLKLGLICYEWTIIFIPSEMDIRDLHGSTFGRGLALDPASILVVPIPIVGIQLGVMPGNIGTLLFATCRFGIAASAFTFPKMIFRLKSKHGGVLKLHKDQH